MNVALNTIIWFIFVLAVGMTIITSLTLANINKIYDAEINSACNKALAANCSEYIDSSRRARTSCQWGVGISVSLLGISILVLVYVYRADLKCLLPKELDRECEPKKMVTVKY